MSGSRRSGMTLLEVVLAMGILALGISSLLTLLAFGSAVSSKAQARAGAVSALSSLLPTLQESAFPLDADGQVGEPALGVERPVPGHPRFRYTLHGAAVDRPAGGPELWRLEVRISWRRGGAVELLSHTTLLPREVPLGERLRQGVLRQGPRSPSNRPSSP